MAKRFTVPRNWTVAQRLEHYSIPEPNSGCWLWLGRLYNGYGKLRVGHLKVAAHRLAWELVNGPIPEGLIVRHKCDVPCCINPAHLKVGTHSDNTADRVERGRSFHPLGVLHPMVKLAPEQIRAIRSDARVQTVIAAEYGIAQSLVSRIKRRKLWGHLL